MRKGELIKSFMFICVLSENRYILDISEDLCQGLISLDTATYILKTAFWDMYNVNDYRIM